MWRAKPAFSHANFTQARAPVLLKVEFFLLRDNFGYPAYEIPGGSREAAAEPILHPRVESSRGFQRVKGRGFQDGIFFGERGCTDTWGFVEAKSSQARRLCHHN